MAFWSWLAFGIPNLVNGLISRQKQEDIARQSKEHQLALTQKQQEQQLKIEELRQSVNWAINQQNAELQRWRFEKEKELQKKLAAFNRETQLALAAYQRETTLSLPEANKIFENWPLRIVPSQILDSQHSDEKNPLRILISPPDVNFDRFGNLAPNTSIPRVESYLSQKLKDFLDSNYSSDDRLRPTEFLDGAFDSKRYHGGSSIKVLFQMLKSEPTLVLESEIDGDYLNFRFAYWGLGETKPVYKTIFSQMPYRDTVYDSAKARALSWKPARDRLKAQGKNPLTFNEIDTYNLEILEVEEDLQRSGLDVSQLRHKYKLNSEDFKNFFQFLVTYHCLVVGWITDFYYFSHYDVAPLLPELLPNLINGIPSREAEQEVIQAIASSYQQAYDNWSAERSCWTPELMLQLAQSLAQLEDRSWAKEQVKASVKAWLKLRGVPLPNTNELAPLLEAMKPVLVTEDQDYVKKLNQYLVALGEKPLVIDSTLLKLTPKPELVKAGHFSEGFAAVKIGNKWGYINTDGQIAILPRFDSASLFREEIAPVKIGDRWGYIDKSGQIAIPLKFDNALHFREGLGAIEIDEKWGYIDKSGQIVIEPTFDDVMFFSEGLAAIQIGEKWGYINKIGEVVLEPMMYQVGGDFREGLASFKTDKYGFLNQQWKIVIDPQFDRAEEFSEGLVAVQFDNKWGYIDKNGQLIIEPQFYKADNFYEGLACVDTNLTSDKLLYLYEDLSCTHIGKCCFINKSGSIVIQNNYAKASNFSEGLAAVEIDGVWGYIDKRGEEIILPMFERASNFFCGIARVEFCGEQRYIDKMGNFIY